MTATDQPTPPVGDVITTAEQLDALPARTRIAIGSGDDVLLDYRDGWAFDETDRIAAGGES